MLRVSVGVFFLVKVVSVTGKSREGEHGEVALRRVVCHFCGVLLSVLFASCLSSSWQPQSKEMSETTRLLPVFRVKPKADCRWSYWHLNQSISYKNNMSSLMRPSLYYTISLCTRNGMVRMEKSLKTLPVNQIRQIQITSLFLFRSTKYSKATVIAGNCFFLVKGGIFFHDCCWASSLQKVDRIETWAQNTSKSRGVHVNYIWYSRALRPWKERSVAACRDVSLEEARVKSF